MRRSASPIWAILALCFVALAPSARAAGPYDPDVPYSTLTTPHFYVMYPEGYGHIALRAARIAEDARPHLIERYDWEPDGRVSIVINDQTDFANGSASIIPIKVVTLFVSAPTRVSGLEDYDDWLYTVLIHELAHIWHLDMAYGLPWVGRLLFGKYASMNVYNPGWVTEGLAVYEETASTGAGRGRSTYVDMVIRAASLGDRFPGIDQGYRAFPDWPYANIAYFFGGRFQLWLRERYGEDALAHYHRAYASNPIPFFTYLPATIAFGESMESLWDVFEEDMREEALRTVEQVSSSSLAASRPVRLTFHGGESVGPQITPDGAHIVFSTASPVDGSRMRRIDIEGENDEVLVNDTLSQAICFTADGSAFYFQQTEINQRFYFQNSLYRYDLKRESFSQVRVDPNAKGDWYAPSGSLRARDPDVSRDGKRLVFVQTPYGSNRIVLAWLESDGVTVHPKVLVPAEPDVQFANPRFSPDGQLIAVSRFYRGRRDIVIYDLKGNLVEEVTRDRAQDTDPTFTRDGEWLVFSSDRTGIYNIYAFHLEKRELRQVTNLVTGGFQPSVSPDGATLVFRGYSADGFDVYKLPFDPDRGLLVAHELVPPVVIDTSVRAWPPREASAPEVPPPAPFKDTPMPKELPEDWEIDGYSALDTILPFNDNWNLFPTGGKNEREFFGSLTHFGTDALQTHSYVLSLTYGTFTKFLGGGAAYTLNTLEPSFSFFATADAVTYGDALLVESDPRAPCPFEDEPLDFDDGRRICYGAENGAYNERQLAAQFSIGLPVKQRHFFSISYIFEHRQALDDLPDGTLTQILPASGNFARVQLGYTYSNIRAFPYSISPERGPSFAIALSALSKGLGSDFEQLFVTTRGRYYLSMPWTAKGFTNHVLATELALGIGAGPDLAQTFRLGGVAGSSALTTTTSNFYGLRGIGTSSQRGTGVISGSTEYRAPIFRVDRGVGTLPIALSVLHAAVFADYGRVFDARELGALKDRFFDELAVGVGAEIRADLILTYSLPITLRLGYAHPVVVPDSLPPQQRIPGLYFQLGSTF